MRVMVVYAHPVETSFNAAIYATVRGRCSKGATGRCRDLCRNFPAIMSREMYRSIDIPANRAGAAVDQRLSRRSAGARVPDLGVRAARHPEGVLRKVFVPGVAFELVDGKVRGMRHLGASAACRPTAVRACAAWPATRA